MVNHFGFGFLHNPHCLYGTQLQHRLASKQEQGTEQVPYQCPRLRLMHRLLLVVTLQQDVI
jgi:hypothetical protein